jgi:hypothetical protein
MTQGYEVLIGLVLPVVLEFVNKYIKSSGGKFAVSLIIPLLIGVVINIGSLKAGSVEEVLESGTIVFTAAQAMYKLYFKDSTLQKRINA